MTKTCFGGILLLFLSSVLINAVPFEPDLTLKISYGVGKPYAKDSAIHQYLEQSKRGPANLTAFKQCAAKALLAENSPLAAYLLAEFSMFGYPKKPVKSASRNHEICEQYELPQDVRGDYEILIKRDPLNVFERMIWKALWYATKANEYGHKEGPVIMYFVMMQSFLFNHDFRVRGYQSARNMLDLLHSATFKHSDAAKLILAHSSLKCESRQRHPDFAEFIQESYIEEMGSNNSGLSTWKFAELLHIPYYGADCGNCMQALNMIILIAGDGLKRIQEDGGDTSNLPRLDQIPDLDKLFEDAEAAAKFTKESSTGLEGPGETNSAETAPSEAAAEEVEILQQSAISGNLQAQLAMAEMYFFGNPAHGIERDVHRAAEYFELAANQGNEHARYSLGLLHLQNMTGENDTKRGVELFEEAAANGSPEALNGLGYVYLNGVGVEVNVTKAKEYFEEAAELGHVEAYSNLGVLYFNGEGGMEKNETKAAEYFVLAAKQNQFAAMYNVGVLYVSGVKIDLTCEEVMGYLRVLVTKSKHKKWLKKAFELFKVKDFEGAAVHYHFAAMLGFDNAVHSLNFMIEQGYVEDSMLLRRDRRLTELYWLYEMALFNGSEAMLRLGDIFYYGSKSLEVNFPAAFAFYENAVNVSRVPATMHSLAHMYANGLGVEKNLTKSEDLYDEIIEKSLDGEFDIENIVPAIISRYVVSWGETIRFVIDRFFL